MTLFSKQLGQPPRENVEAWMAKVEQYINDMQEQMEYGYRQLQKRVEQLEGSGSNGQ